MTTVLLEDADSQLTQLVDQVSKGEKVIVVRNHKPIAKLVPMPQTEPVSHFGNAKDILIYMADDFDAPLEDFKDYM